MQIHAMGHLFSTPPLAKLTRPQLVAKAPALVEIFVMPFLVIVTFIFARPLSDVPYLSDLLHIPPSLPFLRDQYDFLLAYGADPFVTSLSLRLFEILIWSLIPIISLRVILSPILFGLIDLRERIKATGGSVAKFVAGWLIMAGAIWASTDIRASSSATGLTSLLKASPQAYIGVEAFVFISSSILFVEESIALIDMAVARIRERKSSQLPEESKSPDEN